MTGIEVLAPLRLETRFVAPQDRDDGVAQWMLRLRVFPDEFSIRRGGEPPSPDELDRVEDVVGSLAAQTPLDVPAAFASLAAAVGGARALWLWRSFVVDDGSGVLTVDRGAQTVRGAVITQSPVGLPRRLDVWFVSTNGSRDLVAELNLDLEQIALDLQHERFHDPTLGVGELPNTWWLSYPRAVEVGLGIDIDMGAQPPDLDALLVVGGGEVPAEDLVDAHNAAGRLAVLAPGTPTNTVEGDATADLGGDPDSWSALLDLAASDQPSSTAALTALTGRMPPSAMPMLGGHLDHFGPGCLAVEGLWPVLWGRALRDVLGAGAIELDVARWARDYLRVEGSRPAIRIGEQPYGLLPTSAFERWVSAPEEETRISEVEERILRWALPWRAGAAKAAESAGHGSVRGADTALLLGAMSRNAPTRHWRVRPVTELHIVQAARALSAMPPMPASEWDRNSALAWRDVPYPQTPKGPAGGVGALPGPAEDEHEDPGLLHEMCFMHPERLYFDPGQPLGLVGHLVREALLVSRAILGEAVVRWRAGDPVELGQPIPFDEDQFSSYVMAGDEDALEELRSASDDNGRFLAKRFDRVRDALSTTADLWERRHDQLFAGVLAALDTASFRVDPWLTGVAERRLERFAADGAPFLLGAYGWVDAPKPYSGDGTDALAPGPTRAGMVHAPSHSQALAAALLRDAAVRYPDEDRWRIGIDSAKVRAAVSLAERVRLGVHPYEALGLEVERLAGSWDVVRILRRDYPTAADQQLRRVCDGAQVLRAAREGRLSADLPGDLAGVLTPLDDVLDTYADLLVLDGAHALVSGRADLANAAMEAAAGLGAPPELRALRTPRAATTVRVSAWAVLPAGGDHGRSVLEVADPGYAAALGGTPLGDPAAERLAVVLGGGEDDAPEPSLTGGSYEVPNPDGADANLRAAMVLDLQARLQALAALANQTADEIRSIDPDTAGAPQRCRELTAPWGYAPEDALDTVVADQPEVRAPELCRAAASLLQDRVATATGGAAPTTTSGLRRAIRTLAGHQLLPVLPIVDRSMVPVLRGAAGMDVSWLEVVAAVRPRLAALEAQQLDPSQPEWSAAVAAPEGSVDPWHPEGPVIVAYGPGLTDPVPGTGQVAISVLDAWTDSVPSRRHTTSAVFGFNAPKSRAPQAILIAVPPDPHERLTNEGLVEVVLGTRELAHARGAGPGDRDGLPYSTPSPLVHQAEPVDFLAGWP
ncbi:hypothetical protein N801_19045 [Knoellia aerolata DSM 18566]|uniref:Uncharacterized protein n=1 Tax=Knoellia aerolata DSM 18566 TaxID=1385519 RepID=A0A0A0JQL7_9MICO|nr:hypothetical protein [Knoellia aerolata]KGN39775.1 hypothetical protein N801_19045 [Knoellia aerolata DSM 18566]